MPDSWSFSPKRLWGHRDRLGLSRAQLGARARVSQNAIKLFEYGRTDPRMTVFLSLCDSLGISPNDLCRKGRENDEQEYEAGLNWSPPPQAAM